MITNVLLCASALMLGDPAATGQKPQPAAAQKANQTARPEANQPRPSNPPAKKTDGNEKSPSKSPAPQEPEEKDIDGVKLITIEANVVAYTNEERTRNGLPPLTVDKDLMETAREQASWMTRCRVLRHTRRMVAENIAMGQPHSSEAVRCWMCSPGHRANILNPNHRRIGVAAYRTEDGTIFWCQQFQP